MSSSTLGILISIVVYMAFMIYIGYVFSKRTENTGDFYLGGRKLGPFVTAMSAEASDMSGWLLMGLPGLALFINGFSSGSVAEAAWTAIGLAAGTYLNWLFVAKRLRRYTYISNNSVTLPEFFQNRYRDNTKILRTISALFIVVFFIPYTASGFVTCGKLFTVIFNIDYVTAMLISAAVIVLYTSLGGFNAASTTDFIQSIIMTFALILVLGFGIVHAGGINAAIDNASKIPSYLSLTAVANADGTTGSYNWLTIASTLAWGLGYFGMPHILLRFMAIEDEKKLSLSRRVATVWVIISMFVAIAIGVVGYSLVANGTITNITDGEQIIVVIADVISKYGFVFALIAGLVLAGILASTMSTADSQLLAAASSISEDVAGSFGKQLSDKKKMVIARITVIIIAIISVFFALDPNSSVFRIVSFAWAGFGAAFGPVVLLALFWKRSNKWGAIAGMITGGSMVFIWKFIIAGLGGLFAIYELLPAFIIGLIVNIVVSLITPAPEKEIVEEFEAVGAIK